MKQAGSYSFLETIFQDLSGQFHWQLLDTTMRVEITRQCAVMVITMNSCKLMIAYKMHRKMCLQMTNIILILLIPHNNSVKVRNKTFQEI